MHDCPGMLCHKPPQSSILMLKLQKLAVPLHPVLFIEA
ncbi:hypothetical protein SPV1_11316 [Mariprofundus ferrooxydans PV-1]|uniref:Uncharacterized protein n=1 Tax=Mariprofundus ferrooxydans PV-1 TaxID=314345 RepID=Q0F173_9PROT|nr:hypothetical protein SPV1_11316 [Mariprofundus ferrooxydans PV-1]